MRSEVRKSTRGMPRVSEATKDAISCDKLGVEAHTRSSPDFRMGQPPDWKSQELMGLTHGGKRRELKHLSTCRKRK